LWQNIGNQAAGIAGLHWLGVEHNEAKSAVSRMWSNGFAQAIAFYQQAALAATNPITAGKKRASRAG
jgi:hypothetical protein